MRCSRYASGNIDRVECVLVNSAYWLDAPWLYRHNKGLGTTHRLALRPAAELHLPVISAARRKHKRQLLLNRYHEVVALTDGAASMQAQALLLTLPIFNAAADQYADGIADAALQVSADLCLLDLHHDQTLVAACVCAPSYWLLADKIGRPLWQIHAPVPGMNDKIGPRISQFIQQLPAQQAFRRTNWFVHGDAELFHPRDEDNLPDDPARWTMRSEYQTLYRLSPRYVLFAIDVICEPLVDVLAFSTARRALLATLRKMDQHEIDHSGGHRKHQRLMAYLSTH